MTNNSNIAAPRRLSLPIRPAMHLATIVTAILTVYFTTTVVQAQGGLLSVLFILGGASAQEPTTNLDEPSSLLVVVARSEHGIRLTAPGAVALRLEVFAPSGERVLETGFRPGSVFDWALQTGAQQPLPDGSYFYAVTTKSLSWRLSQRSGLVLLQAGAATLRAFALDDLTAAQRAAWKEGRQAQAGPSLIVAEEAVTILAGDDTPSLTIAAHDGRDGQLTSTIGDLTLRTGDLLRGEDRERVRVTSEGRVGIGTDKPEATLDVTGDIRSSGQLHAAKGVRFDDGTVLSSAPAAAKIGPDGTAQLLVDGSGTTNRVTKWTDGPAGTLGDSALTELNGKLGIGTSNPNFELSLFGNDVGVQMVSPATGAARGDGFRFGIDSTNKAFLFNQEPTDMYFGTNALERMRILSSGNVGIGTPAPTAKLAVSGSGAFNAAGAARFDLFNTTANVGFFQHVFNDGRWQLGTGSSTRLLVDTAGNLGIGTGPAAGHKLDVAGVINSATQYNIRGSQVLSIGVANSLNTFAGLGAGASTTGGGNSFFGDAAGQSNTTGNSNSFFGRGAGVTNSTGSQNSLFGAFANSANGLTNATAVGFAAFVEQSNSLVLGSVAGKNGALTNTNVGIGTTAPTSRLEVRDGEIRSTGSSGGIFAAHNPNNQNARVLLDWFNDGTRDWPRIRYGGSGEGAANGFLIQGAGDSTKLAVFDSGVVAIGTSQAGGRLQVNSQQVHVFEDTALNVTLLGSLGFGVVALFENTSTDPRADVLKLRVGTLDHPTDENNYITFLEGSNHSVGAIEGNGSGGISFVSGSADYAEWLPRLNPAEKIQPGEIVGLVEGRITKNTRDAVQMMAVSTGPIILGNDPGEKERANYEKVAFIGQVMVPVRGLVKAGDFIVASGLNDGTGIAVSPERITSEQFEQAVGQAWESSADLRLKSVRTAVGLLRRDPTVTRLVDANRRQARQIKALSDQLTTLESVMKKELAALKFLASDKKKTMDQRASAQSRGRRRAKRSALPKV